MESDTSSPIFIQRTVILHKKQESCIFLIPKELILLPSTALSQHLPLKDPSPALQVGCSPGSLAPAACQAPLMHLHGLHLPKAPRVIRTPVPAATEMPADKLHVKQPPPYVWLCNDEILRLDAKIISEKVFIV